jgi:hypothetical protein
MQSLATNHISWFLHVVFAWLYARSMHTECSNTLLCCSLDACPVAAAPWPCAWCAGRCIGSARGTRKGTILLQYEWGEPYAGCGTDEFELGEDGRLRVHTILHVGGQSVRYTQVYNRKE